MRSGPGCVIVNSGRRIAPLLAPLCSLVLGACAVDEKAEVNTYRSILDHGLHESPQDSGAGPLTVVDSMTLANLRNETLSIQGETYLQSLIDQRRALAAFLPTVTLAPTYLWQEKGPGDDRGWETPVQVGLAVNPVRDIAVLKQTQAGSQTQRALLLDVQDSLLIDVARAHYEVILAEQAIDVIENSLAVQDERVADAQARLDAGLVRPLDVSLTQAQAAQTAVDLVIARNRLATSRTLLEFLIVAPLDSREVVDSLALPDELPEPETLIAEAERRRQDVLAAKWQITEAQRLVESAYGEYFPTISLNLEIFLQRDIDPSDLDWTSFLQFSVPLFTAGLIEADVRAAMSVLRQARLNDSLVRRAAQRDVETAYENLLSAARRAEQLRIEVRSSGEALEQAEGLYQVGLATNLERLAAQDRLLSSQLQLVVAELDRKILHLDLLRNTGTLHELLGLRRDNPPMTAQAPQRKDADAEAR